MKLIGSAASPYVRKVRVVLAEKRLDYQFVIEDVWAADTTISNSNPLGKVPCLIMEGGEAMFDSRVIVEYLDTLSPVGKLIPPQGPTKGAARRLFLSFSDRAACINPASAQDVPAGSFASGSSCQRVEIVVSAMTRSRAMA